MNNLISKFNKTPFSIILNGVVLSLFLLSVAGCKTSSQPTSALPKETTASTISPTKIVEQTSIPEQTKIVEDSL